MDDFDDLDLDLDDLGGMDVVPADDLDSVGLADPIDAPDAASVADVTFGETVISGGSAVEAVPADELIPGADGRGYDGYYNYTRGLDPYDPV